MNVANLMRSLPPHQIHDFLKVYDEVPPTALEKLINKKLDNRWWAVVRINYKYGGMKLKSGLHTSGAQHLTSLVNSTADIKTFVLSWNLQQNAEDATHEWFCMRLKSKIISNICKINLMDGEKFGVTTLLPCSIVRMVTAKQSPFCYEK